MARSHRETLCCSKTLEMSPSLNNYPQQVQGEEYALARELAAAETGLPLAMFAELRPFSLEEVFDSGYLPVGIDSGASYESLWQEAIHLAKLSVKSQQPTQDLP
ncbi:DUF29 family protein [Gloeobacter violaceus]|uniref:Glr3420 protein n=1 Tax=Gloeobacter violaceus (strain ATCC 29082 / PCC 7421) TaxID=251221 RepID=Q7NFV4_GLOVI|nr:DUF29 family protein [Gloeobacter violaceus]BAC91361.1 glr3420 [Gloeobacter violaceus PCC 7421]